MSGSDGELASSKALTIFFCNSPARCPWSVLFSSSLVLSFRLRWSGSGALLELLFSNGLGWTFRRFPDFSPPLPALIRFSAIFSSSKFARALLRRPSMSVSLFARSSSSRLLRNARLIASACDPFVYGDASLIQVDQLADDAAADRPRRSEICAVHPGGDVVFVPTNHQGALLMAEAPGWLRSPEFEDRYFLRCWRRRACLLGFNSRSRLIFLLVTVQRAVGRGSRSSSVCGSPGSYR